MAIYISKWDNIVNFKQSSKYGLRASGKGEDQERYLKLNVFTSKFLSNPITRVKETCVT